MAKTTREAPRPDGRQRLHGTPAWPEDRLGKSALSERMNYRRPFTLDEAYAVLRLFHVPINQLHEIFPPCHGQ